MGIKTHIKRLRTTENGFSDYLTFMIVLPLLIMVIVGGSYVAQSIRVMGALNHALTIVDNNMTQDGSLTSNGQTQLISYLQNNGLDLSKVYLNATTTPQSFGSRGLQATIGYDLDLYAPGSTQVIWHKYYEASVPMAQSQYIPNSGADASGAVQLSSVFAGVQGGTSSGGSTSSSTSINEATSMTIQANNTTPWVNAPVILSGKVYFGSNPAPSGTQVSLSGGGVSQTVSTDSTGSYSASVTFTETGTVQFQGASGAATASVSLTVKANSPGTINLQIPTSVQVGEAFIIGGTVLDQAGNPVVDGTNVTISSSDTIDIPSQTVTTQNGNFSYSVNAITSLNPVTITATAGTASATQNVSVIPGSPKTISLNLSATSLAAGSTMTFSGQVLGPYGTPPAQGTPVTILSGTDTVDTIPKAATDANGNFTVSATLTQAGSQAFYAQTTGPVDSATATAAVTPGSPYKVNGITGTPNPVNAGANLAISGYVSDQYGNPVASGTTLQMVSSALPSPVSTSVLSGTFNAKVTLQTPGIQTLTVEDESGNPLAGGSLSVNVLATAAYSLTPSQEQYAVTAGQSVSNVVFTLKDSNGQPVVGKTIQFSETPQGSTLLTPASAVTDASGQVQTTVGPLTTVGSQTLMANLAGDTSVVGTVGISVSPGSPSHVIATVSPSTTQVWTAANPVPLPVISGTVTDAYGNPISGSTVTVAGGYGVSASGTTNSNGGFTISITPTNIGGPYPINITVGGITFSGMTNIVVSQYPSTSIKMWALNGTTVYTGQLYPVVAELFDQGQNPMNGQSISFSVLTDTSATVMNLTPSGPGGSGMGTLAQTTGTYVNGQAGVNIIFDQPGSQSVEVKYNDTVQILTVTVYPSSVSQIAWNPVQPGTAVTAGTTLTVSGVALNSLGQPVPNGTQITLSMPGSNAANQTVYTGTNGYFSGGLVPKNVGSWNIQSVSAGNTFSYSTSILVKPGAVSQGFVHLWNTQTNYASGSSVSIGGQVMDQYGNPVSGVNIVFSILSQPSGSNMTAVNNSSWLTDTTGNLSIVQGPFNVIGNYTIGATCNGVTLTPLTISIVTVVPTPAALSGQSGSTTAPLTVTIAGQNYSATGGYNGSQSGSPFNITAGTTVTISGYVVNSGGIPLANQQVVWGISGNGQNSLLTDSNGHFSISVTPTIAGNGANQMFQIWGVQNLPWWGQQLNVLPGPTANLQVMLNPLHAYTIWAPEGSGSILNSVTIIASDQYGNPETGITATISTSTTDPNIESGLPKTVNITNGVGMNNGNISFYKGGTWPITVTTSDGKSQTEYFNVN